VLLLMGCLEALSMMLIMVPVLAPALMGWASTRSGSACSWSSWSSAR
jgi:hypothetical protein